MLYRIAAMLLACSLLLSLPVEPLQQRAAADGAEPVIVVKSSPRAARETELRLPPKWIRALKAPLEIAGASEPLPLTDTYVRVQESGVAKLYGLDDRGRLFDELTRGVVKLSSGVENGLALLKQEARTAHYGELRPWSEVKELLPIKSVSTVTDVETGLQFQVQRRAGKQHADMQPMTKADTATMKKIYDGQWSWRRRAVLVERDGLKLAASMHGMPHGGDGIPDNGFPGHFCIHFLGSTTHGSGQVDPDHQWMVHKAAGRYLDKFAKATPPEIVESFFTAINQQDPELMKYSFGRTDHPQLLSYLQEMELIKAIRPIRPKAETKKSRSKSKSKERAKQEDKRDPAQWNTLTSTQISVPLTIHQTGRRPEGQTFIFELKRASVDEPWKIDVINRSPANRKQ